MPMVPPIVRTAAVDRAGGLWISFTLPFTYVYDADGEKTRVVQFYGAGIMAPTSLSFARDGQLLVTPGCYVFDPAVARGAPAPVADTTTYEHTRLTAATPPDLPGRMLRSPRRYDAGTAGRG